MAASMHTGMNDGKKRRRRRPASWLEGATTCVVTCLLLSSCTALSYNNNDNNNHNDNTSSWVQRVWRDSVSRIIAIGQPQDRWKPMTVVLEEESSSKRRSLRRRRVQEDFTLAETDTPTFAPAPSPSVTTTSSPTTTAPTFRPSRQNRQADQPTEVGRPLIPFISKSTKETPAPVQPLTFAAVPVGFDVLLETDSQQDLQEMALQAKIILEEHLVRAFMDGFDGSGEGVAVRSVDLNVKSFLTNEPSLRNRLLQRVLQLQRAITLEARGVAGFQVHKAVDTNEFLTKVNTIIDEAVRPEQLTSVFQNNASGLSDYRVSSVTNTEAPEEEPKEKPTLVEIIIAIVLLVLAAAGLVAYAVVFYKKRQKRLKRRKQFGVGHKPPSPYPRPRPHGASVTPTGTAISGLPTSVTRPTFPSGNSSSSESSYKGLGSDSDEEDADVFAKELRMAASLDRKAWDDFQKQTTGHQHRQRDRHDPHSPIYNIAGSEVYRDLAAISEGGAEVSTANSGSVYGLSEELASPGGIGLTVTGDTVSIQSNSSFPYGDEGEHIYGGNRSALGGSGEREVFEDELERDDSADWQMTKSASTQLNDKGSSRKKPSRFSFLYGTESKTESNSTESPSEGKTGSPRHSDSERTSGALRGSPMSQSWSTNPPRGGGSGESATTAAIRGSPQTSSSWNSTGGRPMSQDGSLAASPAAESNAAVNLENASAAFSEDASMATADIVQEVQRLSQFVKTYEKKKDIRMQREHDGVDDSMASSMDYDSLMEQVASLQNVVGGRDAKKQNRREDDFDGVQSIQSDDSSDAETMESDDLSRRLGITPFQVQNPNTLQRSPVSAAPSYNPGALYQRTASPENAGHRKEPAARHGSSKQSLGSSALKSLRHTDAILDGSVRDEGTSNEVAAQKRPASGHNFHPNPLRNPQTITPRQRSHNQGFNSIVSKFEARSSDREPIYPPNESWQYNY